MLALKEFNNQSLATLAKKGEQLVSIMPAFNKTFSLLGDDIIDLSTEKDVSKDKIGFYYENWLEVSKANLLKQLDDEKRANLILSRMKKTGGKRLNKWLILVIINYGKINLITSVLKKR